MGITPLDDVEATRSRLPVKQLHEMAKLIAVGIIALTISYASAQLAATTPPQERPVADNVRFYYEDSLHYLVGSMISNCFLAPLTSTEDDHVKIHDGIEDLMLTMTRDWIGVLAETRIYHDDPNLPADIKSWCSGRDIYLIERNLPAQTTPVSPLSG